MRKWIAVIGITAIALLLLPGCDWIEEMFRPAPPECPYPEWVCDALDHVDFNEWGERVGCVVGCFGDE